MNPRESPTCCQCLGDRFKGSSGSLEGCGTRITTCCPLQCCVCRRRPDAQFQECISLYPGWTGHVGLIDIGRFLQRFACGDAIFEASYVLYVEKFSQLPPTLSCPDIKLKTHIHLIPEYPLMAKEAN